MTKDNPAGLRVAPEKYRVADIVLAVAFLISGAVGLYFALVDGVRDYWLLVLVGIVGAVLMARRAMGGKSIS